MNALETYNKLTPKGKALMALVGNWTGSFFDDGAVEHSGIWGGVLASEGQVTATAKGMGGVLAGLLKAEVFYTTEEPGDDGDWWALTALGAEVAKVAASAVADTTVYEAPVVDDAPAVKTCKKDASHGPHRITKSGSYCYACDRIAADVQKLARNLARNNAAAKPTHDCTENAVPYTSDGPLGHGWECGVCGAFLQAG